MAKGRIPERDIAAIRDAVAIEDIVGEYVSLKPAGHDSLKGLSPFKDERTPSFHVRPNHGYFHCFSTGEGGDVFSFLMKMEHIGFVEAVEQVADRIGYTINYEGGGPSVQKDRGTRLRLVQANAAAQAFYAAQLETPAAEPARRFLLDREFDASVARHFGCGYAPEGWDTLTRHLQEKGFTFAELESAGLSKMGRQGPIDRFHRRLLWPIRNLAGDVIGFGARKLFDDDQMGKYMNTPETMLYKKSQVLFGVDLAKKHIASAHQAVVVEGYTDVMAMHLAGVPTAVAACGTAFGDDHLSMLRRLMLDDSYFRGEIIYTFDGDEAGKAAALKAFRGNQQFVGQSFVSVAPDGMDPCDLRQKQGDAAVRDLVARRVPMIEFVLKATIEEHDLGSVEGRVQALRQAVPLLGEIRDETLRREYARLLDGWVGWNDPTRVLARVEEEHRRGPRRTDRTPPRQRVVEKAAAPPETPAGPPRPHPRDPRLWPQRDALKAALQEPALAGSVFDALPGESFDHPAYQAVRQAIADAGGCTSGLGGAEWRSAVLEHTAHAAVRSLVTELSVEELSVDEVDLPRHIGGVLARLQEVWVGRQVADLKSQLQRMSPSRDADAYRALFGDLVALEEYRRGLLERAVGDRGE